MLSLFVITDGTTTVDLMALNKNGWGIGIDSYTPGRAQMKDGGYWQNSPVATGRRLAYSVKENVNDALTIKFSYRSHNEIIQEQERLDGLIEQAANYWQSEWADTPVYIKAQAQGESSPRYAIVYNITFDNYQDPYSQPFNTLSPPYVADGIVLGVERSVWLENAPGTGTSISFTSEKHSTATTTDVVMSNYRNGGLSHIYAFTGSFGSNLLSSSPPYNLFSGTIAAGSICYFGSSYPFSGLVFDLSVAMTATSWTIVWEYSTGGGTWGTLGTFYYTKFEITGTFVIRWTLDSTWVTDTVNSVASKYWVRARVSAKTGTVTAPRQQNQHVYAAAIPYASVASTQIGGHIDALMQYTLAHQPGAYSNDGATTTILSLRSASRGTNFTNWLNVKTADNPTGISVTLYTAVLHASTSVYVTDSLTATGYNIQYTGTTGDVMEEIFRVAFSSTIAAEYCGRYRLFARVNVTDLTGSTQIRYGVNFGALLEPRLYGNTKTIASLSVPKDFIIVDLGYISLPPSSHIRASETSGGYFISIEALTPNTKVLEVIDLCLMPVDEWSATLTQSDPDDYSVLLRMDSIGYPKYDMRGLQYNSAGTSITYALGVQYNSEAIMHANTSQNLWILQYRDAGDGAPIAFLDMHNMISAKRQQRYLGLRSS